MIKRIILFTLIVLIEFVSLTRAQEMPPLVYQQEGMEKVTVKRMVFKTIGQTKLQLDVYFPPDMKTPGKVPLVIIHNCSGMELPDWRNYQDMARLIALSGIAAITYQSRPYNKEDSEDLIEFIRTHGEGLQVDADRMGIFTTSGNATIGVPLVLDKMRKYIRCAAIYYGMPDTIESIKPLRQDISLFITRAGLDEFRANRNIDRFIEEALNSDLDMQLVNYPEGHHGFDVLDNTETSKTIIRQTLHFFREKLSNSQKPVQKPGYTAKQFYSQMREGKIESAISSFYQARKQYQKDQFYRPFILRSLILMGQDLFKEKKIKAAIETFKLTLEVYPDSLETCDNLSGAYEQKGDYQQAMVYSQKALDTLGKKNNLNNVQKQEIRKKIKMRIRRLIKMLNPKRKEP